MIKYFKFTKEQFELLKKMTNRLEETTDYGDGLEETIAIQKIISEIENN